MTCVKYGVLQWKGYQKLNVHLLDTMHQSCMNIFMYRFVENLLEIPYTYLTSLLQDKLVRIKIMSKDLSK